MQNRIFFRGPTLVSLNPLRVEYADVLVGDGRILKKGWRLNVPHGVDVVDARGKILMPGLVDAHFDLARTFARFIPPPPSGATHGRQLTEEMLICAAFGATLEALRNGTTTFICHHGASGFVRGSLFRIRDVLLSVGVRVCASFAAGGHDAAADVEAALAESRDAAAFGLSSRCRFMLGAAACDQVAQSTLESLAELGARYDCGLHTTVGFGSSSVDDDIERLLRSKALRPGSLVMLGGRPKPAHIDALREAKVTLIHAPSGQMLSGRAMLPVDTFANGGTLGSAGTRPDLFEEARLAYTQAIAKGEAATPADVVALLARGQEVASGLFHTSLGNFEPGSAADLLVLDYRPMTPLNAATLPWHVLFGFSSAHVQHVMIDGQTIIRDRSFNRFDVRNLFRQTQRAALDLWAQSSTEEYPGLNLPLREDVVASAPEREEQASVFAADESDLEFEPLEVGADVARPWLVANPDANARGNGETGLELAVEPPKLPRQPAERPAAPPPPPRRTRPTAAPAAEAPPAPAPAPTPPPMPPPEPPIEPPADPFGFGII